MLLVNKRRLENSGKQSITSNKKRKWRHAKKFKVSCCMNAQKVASSQDLSIRKECKAHNFLLFFLTLPAFQRNEGCWPFMDAACIGQGLNQQKLPSH